MHNLDFKDCKSYIRYVTNAVLIKYLHFDTSDKMILNLSKKYKYLSLFLNPVELLLLLGEAQNKHT